MHEKSVLILKNATDSTIKMLKLCHRNLKIEKRCKSSSIGIGPL